MKKLTSIIFAALLTMAFATQALAVSFGELDLVRVVYKAGGAEVATNLGNIGTTLDLSADELVVGDGSSAFSLSQFAPGTTWADLRVAYFTKLETSKEAYLSSSDSAAPGANSRAWSNFSNGVLFATTYYSGLTATGSTVVGDATFNNAYAQALTNGGTNPGAFGSYISPSSGEMNLAALVTAGYVDQYLYHYMNNAAQPGVVRIRTFADGSTMINPAAVPVPASVFLLGSGLLALIRRARTRA